MRRLVVAIDGPAGSGKSTAAKALSKRLGYRLLDTGAIYRTVALLAQRAGVAWDDALGCAAIAQSVDLDFRFDGEVNHVFAFGEDLSGLIRTPDISQGASKVSSLPDVRAALLELQRKVGKTGGVVAEGRDVGTVVFPDAEAKFFLVASPEVRAKRRTDELRALGHIVNEGYTLAEVMERDRRDEERAAAPLKQAVDAIRIDSSQLGAVQVLDVMERLVRERAT